MELSIQKNLVEGIVLSNGGHGDRTEGTCAMEAVAWLAGETHSDAPYCACPVIATFVRSWNDGLNDQDRQRLLKPFLLRLIDTRSTPEVELRRSYMALDWLIRVYTPAWLDLTESLRGHAEALRGLPEVVGMRSLQKAASTLDAAGDAAWDAARDAAWAAAWDAARAAARDAAGAAAWAASRAAAGAAARAAARDAAGAAAWAAARDAAGAAAWAAAWAAARDAAGAALQPTVALLQSSAADLLSRMIEAK